MKRIILLLGVFLGIAMIFPVGFTSTAQQRSQMGGRPGEFHFILKDQADHNRVEFREMQLRIERLRADVMNSASDEATKRRMLADIDRFALFASSMEAQFSNPAGQTAGEVEQRLNLVKGQMLCGACHEGSASRTAR